MKFYKIGAKGDLGEINKLEFENNAIYLVDDEKTLYIWFGTEVSQSLKDISIKQTRFLNKERGGAAKLLLMTQNREYGSFKAMMADLKEGLKAGEDVERRPELDMKVPKSVKEEKGEEINQALSDPVGWFVQLVGHRKEAIIEAAKEIREEIPEDDEEDEDEDTFHNAVNIKAYFTSQEGLRYDELCWRLAETQLTIMKGRQNTTEDEIKDKAEIVFNTMCSYDELCWLIGELETMIEKKYL